MRRFTITVFVLAAWIMLLLPGVPAVAQTVSGEKVKLKVLCYNLRFGELASLEELAAFIRGENPDIVALQEVDVRTSRELAPHQKGKDFVTELGFRTGMLTAYARTIDYAGGYYGIGILSKYPFDNTKRYLLPMPEGAREQRALLTADVELPGGKIITFASTHLDHTTSPVRQAQVEAINKALAGNTHPMIVAGDFNAQPQSPEIKDGMRAWGQACSPDFTFPSANPRSKIDYIFFAPENRWKKLSAGTPKVTLSDHLPLWVEVELVF